MTWNIVATVDGKGVVNEYEYNEFSQLQTLIPASAIIDLKSQSQFL